MGIKNLVIMGATLASVSVSFAQTPVKVACVGNSITYGYGLNGATTYPQHLQSILGDGYQVENYGNSGKMFHRASQESYWSQSEFKNANNFAPNIVVIELGTNDSKYFYTGSEGHYNYYLYEYKQNSEGKNYTRESLIAEMKKDYEALIDTFAHQPQAPTIYATLQPYANNWDWFITDTVIVNVINPMIKEVATKKGVNIIDLHTEFNKPEWLLEDNVHPNATGAKELAQIIANAIQKGPTQPNIESSSSVTEVPESSSSLSVDLITVQLRTNYQITVQNGFISIRGFNGKVDVFDLNGTLVKQVHSNGITNIRMEHPGAYIVKTGSVFQKVNLK